MLVYIALGYGNYTFYYILLLFMPNALENVLSAIDNLNSQDINQTLVNSEVHPKEFIYRHRMTACLNEYWPEANDLLQKAIRGQHIKRWHIKQSGFEQGKAGYLLSGRRHKKIKGPITSSITNSDNSMFCNK